jgi:riboflavin synthase
MFTGLITGLGRIAALHDLGRTPTDGVLADAAAAPRGDYGKRLTLQAPSGYLDDVALGDSIAINGACMTVTAMDARAGQFCIEISAESLDKTAGLTEPGPVNLEKALRAHDRLGGHIVAGHVDGVGRVSHFEPVGESWELRIQAPHMLAKYLAYKGSVAVNGVSLTVNAVADNASGCEASINLIAHTLQNTTLHALRPGSPVNLEIDLIARYVERMLSAPAAASSAAREPTP